MLRGPSPPTMTALSRNAGIANASKVFVTVPGSTHIYREGRPSSHSLPRRPRKALASEGACLEDRNPNGSRTTISNGWDCDGLRDLRVWIDGSPLQIGGDR